MFEQAATPFHLADGQKILNPAGGAHHQGEALPAECAGESGNVQHADDFSIGRMPDHRGRAGPSLDPFAVMLGGVDLNRLADGQSRADRVGTAKPFTPANPLDESNRFGRVLGGRVALPGQNRAAGVGQHHHGAGFRQEITRAGHCRRAGFEQFLLALAQKQKIPLRNRLRTAVSSRVHFCVVAASPRRVDESPQSIQRGSAIAEETFPGGHDTCVLTRVREHLARIQKLHG
ncbi:hypothetical protein GALL_417900 [mine drainage metagenome]|uniref:Uncharacterized protein n=1 Tax=mine drainage metagenome TaxID=410659 RepID=A0A1J5PYH2_9ZZZZ